MRRNVLAVWFVCVSVACSFKPSGLSGEIAEPEPQEEGIAPKPTRPPGKVPTVASDAGIVSGTVGIDALPVLDAKPGTLPDVKVVDSAPLVPDALAVPIRATVMFAITGPPEGAKAERQKKDNVLLEWEPNTTARVTYRQTVVVTCQSVSENRNWCFDNVWEGGQEFTVRVVDADTQAVVVTDTLQEWKFTVVNKVNTRSRTISFTVLPKARFQLLADIGRPGSGFIGVSLRAGLAAPTDVRDELGPISTTSVTFPMNPWGPTLDVAN